ncbi:MAG: phosphate signaling complex protein PhoU [Chrysiogenales bacterium]|nr:phosphate signaling complex protein PhoU [Candidatus Aminicenantes bacterium]TFG77735.1 MAG: phosphate signaling complex protein PhoU [Chrysiogenales bacterium]
MAREHFQNMLRGLEQELVAMGEMVIAAIDRSIRALKNVDKDEAERIIADDALINQRRWDIENQCIQLFATQQPVAGDLREIVSFIDLITNLERMADHAKGIATIVVRHDQKPLLKPLIDIPRMADKAREMIQKSLTAFITQDVEAAAAIIEMDNEVDALYDQIFRELLTYMMEDPKTITRAVYLIWVSHNLERIADRVTNICERIIFMVTGEIQSD